MGHLYHGYVSHNQRVHMIQHFSDVNGEGSSGTFRLTFRNCIRLVAGEI